ncbi:nickel insertion protein [Peribacillus frigoritolerans]|uniref:nickel insertion protein n=1 Tax=Peribacillus frigoritolerans TaxID=450367 RepID=UPI003F7F6031
MKTPYGTIRFKQGMMDGRVIRQFPEYGDVKGLARKHEVPFYEVYSAALTSL